jgi:RNA polymerase sigma factor (sigma-70 family)
MDRFSQQALFTQIYRETFTRLSQHVFFKTGDLQESEDIVAAVYSDYYQHIVLKSREVENSLAYLKKMADHQISRFLAKRRAMVSLDDEHLGLDEILPDDLDLEDAVFEDLTYEEIWAAILDLKQPEQQVLIARHRLAMSFADIARELGQSESAAKVRYHRTIKKLQKMLL